MCLHCLHGDTNTQAKFTLASGRRFLLLCPPEKENCWPNIWSKWDRTVYRRFFSLAFSAEDSLILQWRFWNAMMATCSSTGILVKVQSTVSCLNALSNDKQVILHSYFTSCLHHWSDFNLFSEQALLNHMMLLLLLVWEDHWLGLHRH